MIHFPEMQKKREVDKPSSQPLALGGSECGRDVVRQLAI
jgi:hypothetical protein